MSKVILSSIEEIEKKIISKEPKAQQTHFLKWKKSIEQFLKDGLNNIDKLQDVYEKISNSIKESKIKKDIKDKLTESLESIYNNLKHQFAKEEIKNLINEKNNLGQELKSKNDIIEKKEKQIAELTEQLEGFTAVKEKANLLEIELGKLREMIDYIKKSNSDLTDKLEVLKSDKENLLKSIYDKDNVIKSKESDIQKLLEEKNNLDIEIGNLKDKINHIEKDNWYKGEAIAKIQIESMNLKNKIKELENVIKGKNEEVAFLTDNVNRFKAKINSLNAEIENAKKVIGSKENYIRKCTSDIENLNNAIKLNEEKIKNREEEIKNLKFKISERDDLIKGFKIDKNLWKELLNTSYNKVLELIEYIDNLKDDFDYYENEIFEKYKDDIGANKEAFIKKLDENIITKFNLLRKENSAKELYPHFEKNKKCLEHSKYCAANNKIEIVPENFREGDAVFTCELTVSASLNEMVEAFIAKLKENITDVFKNDYTHFAIGSEPNKDLTRIFTTVRLSKLF